MSRNYYMERKNRRKEIVVNVISLIRSGKNSGFSSSDFDEIEKMLMSLI